MKQGKRVTGEEGKRGRVIRRAFQTLPFTLFPSSPFSLFLLPQPPPPGVSILTRSPASSSQLPFDPILHWRPSRMIAAVPGFPLSPPDRPYGLRLRLSASNDMCAGANVSISRMTPSPPFRFPFPPEPLRILYSRTRKGYAYSSASAGVFRLFVMC